MKSTLYDWLVFAALCVEVAIGACIFLLIAWYVWSAVTGPNW